MFHRCYSHSAPPPSVSSHRSFPVSPAAGAVCHEVQIPDLLTSRREKLRQRQEEENLKRQLLETEQELDGLAEEEKELARRREELQILNARQTAFHDRRLELEDRIGQALLEFEREGRTCSRDIQELDRARASCRRHLEELEELAPENITPPRGEVALRRQLEFLADVERRLDAELSGLEAASAADDGPEQVPGDALSRCFREGMRFFLPYIGLGTIGLLLFLSLTGGGR